jgi:rhodanese-related sulfurtransferase
MVKNIIIDVREESELKEKSLETDSVELEIINIPMRHIQFNLPYIKRLVDNGKVYLMCNSGTRANKIKKKYFSNNDNVLTLEGGITKIKDSEFKDDVVEKISEKKSNLGMQQYMQIMFMLMMIIVFILIIYDRRYAMLFVMIIIVMILYQLFTKSCVLGKFMMLIDK